MKFDRRRLSDQRPRFIDSNSKLSILLDTGAQVSLWPRKKFDDATYDPSKKLQAVNGTRISTYDTRQITIKHPNATVTFIHEVLLADLEEPILGWDFLLHSKLDIRWQKSNVTRIPAQTNLQKQPPFYMPQTTQTATHVYTKVAKKTPLGPVYEGPYEILERLGDTSLKLRVGTYANGQPRVEIRHWNSCQPAKFTPEHSASKPNLGRPKSNK